MWVCKQKSILKIKYYQMKTSKSSSESGQFRSCKGNNKILYSKSPKKLISGNLIPQIITPYTHYNQFKRFQDQRLWILRKPKKIHWRIKSKLKVLHLRHAKMWRLQIWTHCFANAKVSQGSSELRESYIISKTQRLLRISSNHILHHYIENLVQDKKFGF